MAEEKGLGKFLVYCVLVLLMFLVMIQVTFLFKGKMIRTESLILLFLMLLSLIGLVSYKTDWGERVLFFMFLIGLGNLVFVWHFTGHLFMLPLFLLMVGFLMSLPKRREEVDWGEVPEPHSEVFEEEKPVAKVTHSPGKYVASSMGSVYHEPKCAWAKKISEERRVWFKDKKEAQKKKYKKHKCVK